MNITQEKLNIETFFELVNHPDYADKVLELDEGELIEMSKPGLLHGVVTGNTFGFLWMHVRTNKLGYMTAAETGFVLGQSETGRDIVRGLDVAFIRAERLPDGLPEGWVTVAPDLAVEVISPGNVALDIHKKIRQLFAAGTRLVWIIYPETQTVDVHTREGAHTLEAADMLDGSDVLPGFSVRVGDLFP